MYIASYFFCSIVAELKVTLRYATQCSVDFSDLRRELYQKLNPDRLTIYESRCTFVGQH